MTTSIACLNDDPRNLMREASWLHILAFAAFLLVASPHLPLLAQGLTVDDAIDSIIGSQVHTEERSSTDQSEKVLEAIANADETAMQVRMVFSLEGVTIAFIPEAEEEGSPIAEAVAGNQAAIRTLRQAVQGNAMLFHSIDSQSILLDRILALEFGDDETATIYVAGKDPKQ